MMRVINTCSLVAFLLLRGVHICDAARTKRRPTQKAIRPLRDAASWLSEAAGLHRSGAAQTAVLACVDAALALDPLHASAHYNRGFLLDQLGAPPEDELECYDAALAINPRHAGAIANRGATLRQLGAALEEQLASHDAALALDPRQLKSGDFPSPEVVPGGQKTASHYNKGVVLTQLRASMEEVLECYDAALAIDPQDAPAHANRGATLQRIGAAPEEELACYDAALAIDPLHAGAHRNRGTALKRLGTPPEEELACYDATLAIDPLNTSALSTRGLLTWSLGRFPEALDTLVTQMALTPSRAGTSLLYIRALLMRRLHRADADVRAAFRAAAEAPATDSVQGPGSADSLTDVSAGGFALIALDRLSEASHHLATRGGRRLGGEGGAWRSLRVTKSTATRPHQLRHHVDQLAYVLSEPPDATTRLTVAERQRLEGLLPRYQEALRHADELHRAAASLPADASRDAPWVKAAETWMLDTTASPLKELIGDVHGRLVYHRPDLWPALTGGPLNPALDWPSIQRRYLAATPSIVVRAPAPSCRLVAYWRGFVTAGSRPAPGRTYAARAQAHNTCVHAKLLVALDRRTSARTHA